MGHSDDPHPKSFHMASKIACFGPIVQDSQCFPDVNLGANPSPLSNTNLAAIPGPNQNIAGELKFMYTNSRSLNNKEIELMNRVHDLNPDVIAITETWQKCPIIPGYCMPIVNNYSCRQGHRGGGVVLYIKSCFRFIVLDDLNAVHSESVFCTMCLDGGENICIGCIYRSTNCDIFNIDEENKKLVHVLSLLPVDKMFTVVMGDFNVRDIDWDTLQCGGSDSSFAAAFLDAVLSNFLFQIVKSPTRTCPSTDNRSLLDLVLCSDPDIVTDVEHLDPIDSSDHDVLLWSVLCRSSNTSDAKFIPKVNYRDVISMLQHHNFGDIGLFEDVSDAWNYFKGICYSVVSKCTSNCRLKNKKPWVSPAVIRAIKDKHHAYVTYSASRHVPFLKYLYIQAKKRCKSVCRRTRISYESSIITRSKRNPKLLYNYIRKQTKPKISIQGLKLPDGTMTDTDVGAANLLSDVFRNAFSSSVVHPAPNHVQRPYPDVEDLVVSVDDVLAELESLDITKADGPDKISAKFLYSCRNVIAAPLCSVFNLSIQQGVVPQDWKHGIIEPIYKGAKAGPRNSPECYRSISLTSQVCKVLERIIKKHLVHFLDSNNIIKRFQHGFRSNKDCTSNLIESLDVITRALDEGSDIDIAFLDFQKAFDKVNHKLLLQKLSLIGINGNIHRWIESFLTNRVQCVRVNDVHSRNVDVISGVPQGSVLGPMLFLIYINDLPVSSQSCLSLFADDTKSICRVPRYEVTNTLQESLMLLESWSINNSLPFNIKKCKYMRVTMNTDASLALPLKLYGDYLDRTYEERDLGVLMTSTLDPSKHIAAKVKCANFVLSQIRRSFLCRDAGIMLSLYKTLVRPHLDYCAQVWSPWKQKDIKKVEAVQRRATRLIPACRGLPYAERLRLLKITSLEERRIRGDMILVYKILTDKTNIDKNSLFQMSSTQTRGHNFKLHKPRCNTTIRAKFFSQRCIDHWNSLPDTVVSARSTNCFKSLYDKHMMIASAVSHANVYTV